MPPMYALGYHQGGYGYYNSDRLLSVAKSYRDNQIPIDGLHIDVDFQNNYRTFTSSQEKFGNVKDLFNQLQGMGFKCSTNITGIMTIVPWDESAKTNNPNPPYPAVPYVVTALDENGNVVQRNVIDGSPSSTSIDLRTASLSSCNFVSEGSAYPKVQRQFDIFSRRVLFSKK